MCLSPCLSTCFLSDCLWLLVCVCLSVCLSACMPACLPTSALCPLSLSANVCVCSINTNSSDNWWLCCLPVYLPACLLVSLAVCVQLSPHTATVMGGPAGSVHTSGRHHVQCVASIYIAARKVTLVQASVPVLLFDLPPCDAIVQRDFSPHVD